MILKWFPLVGDIDKVIKVNGVLLDRLVLEEEYVAVLFLGECLEEEKVRKTLTSFGKNFSTRKLAMSLWRVWRRSTRSSTRSTSSLSRLTNRSMPRRIRSKLSQQLASLGKYFNIVHINSSQLEGVLKQREAAVEEFWAWKCFRNGGLLIYDGKLDNAMSLLKWMTDLENLKIDGRIEEVRKGEMREKLNYKNCDKISTKIINETS